MATARKKIATFALVAGLVLFGITFGLAFPASALAWDDCPKGLVNDPYPGACSRYRDTNGDNICDLSQSEPVESTTTTTAAPAKTTTTTTVQKSTATTTTLVVTTTTSGEPPTGDCPLGPCAGCGACFSISSIATVASTDATDAVLVSTDATTPSGGSGGTTAPTAATTTVAATAATASTAGDTSGRSSLLTHYKVSPIATGFFLVYGVSFFLYKTKRIRIATHRKIWNMLLLATFLITGIFGLILTVQLDYELRFTMPINLLFWHVEAGVVMTLISMFHMGWHLNYYRNVLRTSRSKIRAARAAERAQAIDGRQLVLEARGQRRAERRARRDRAARTGQAPAGRAATSGRTPSPYLRPRGRLEPEAD